MIDREYTYRLPRRNFLSQLSARELTSRLPQRRFEYKPPRSTGIPINTVATLRYVYTMRTGGMDIYDLLVPSSPAFSTSLTDGNHSQGGAAGELDYDDASYMWVNQGTTLWVFLRLGNELNPVLVSTVLHLQRVIIRRGVASRNNLLFAYNNNNGNIESYDISDPTNIVLKSFQAPPLASIGNRSFCYDAVGNRLVVGTFNSFNHSYIHTLTVDSSGNLGAPVFIQDIDTSNGFATVASFMYNGMCWVQVHTGVYAPVKLDGSGFGAGGGALPATLQDYQKISPGVKGNYLFLAANNSNAAHQAVLIYDLRTWTLIASLGGAGAVCGGMMFSGNLLIFAIASTLYVYNIVNTLASGSVPTLIGQLACPNNLNGIAGDVTDGWDGNNGGCLN